MRPPPSQVNHVEQTPRLDVGKPRMGNTRQPLLASLARATGKMTLR
jgi:hypothetical protein